MGSAVGDPDPDGAVVHLAAVDGRGADGEPVLRRDGLRALLCEITGSSLGHYFSSLIFSDCKTESVGLQNRDHVGGG